MNPPIVLMTDFDTRDSYVGVMKGVILDITPETTITDLTHSIRPQDVAHGAYTLRVSTPYFPAGTVFCCVVDPGVGSERRAVAVEAGEWTFVLPDNGLLTRVLEEWPAKRVVTLTNRAYHLPAPSATFHGRDIFAPVSAHLAAGVPFESLGELLSPASLHRLSHPITRVDGAQIVGSVMHIDHFGNLVTTITREHLRGDRDWTVELGGTTISLSPIFSTFAEVAPGEPVAYIGSDGFLELAVRNSTAAQEWNVGLGTEVVVYRANE